MPPAARSRGGRVPAVSLRSRLHAALDARIDARIRAMADDGVAAARTLARAEANEARLHDPLVFGDAARLTLGDATVVNDALFNLSSGTITVGEGAFFGHRVSLLTGTHDLTRTGVERQRAIPLDGRDIVVGPGAWIGSNATVLGPCTIGRDAVVAAGAVVTMDEVPPAAIVAGVPARVIGHAG